MANQILWDKFWEETAYQSSLGSSAFKAEMLRKLTTQTAYQSSYGTSAFKAEMLRKLTVLVAYKYIEPASSRNFGGII